MGSIVFRDDRKDVPLSFDIADENRQALAYNMFYHMMNNGGCYYSKRENDSA